MSESTIVAIATPPGKGGIGIIKMSGNRSVEIAEAIFKKSDSWRNHQEPKKRSDVKKLMSHRLYHGYIRHPEKGYQIDEVLLSIMKSPFSYTREDVVEINAHSGYIALNAIMKLILENGARIARPGEFSKRAFLNGRIDLTQAEAVIDIINAKSEKALKIATIQARGILRDKIEMIRAEALSVLSRIEAEIDFSDELEENDDEYPHSENLQKKVAGPLKELLEKYDRAYVLREGMNVAVVGRPNVGKSSLLNRLLHKDRAIVTDIPGTTRDIIEDTVLINDVPVVLADTAGLRSARDPIEAIGIKKTKENIKGADLLIFMIDGAEHLEKDDFIIYNEYKEKNIILAINKIDLVEGRTRIAIPDSWEKLPRVEISALYNINIDKLKKMIVDVGAGIDVMCKEDMVLPNLRQRTAFEKALIATCSAVEGLMENRYYEMIAIEIKDIIKFLDEATGRNTGKDVIGNIFEKFCIGK